MLDILYNIDLTEYYTDTLTPMETLSHSVAKEMLISCKHGWASHPRLGGKPKKTTFSMKLGTILDEVLTNQERRLRLLPYEKFDTKVAKAERDTALAEGLVPVKQKELDYARDRAQSVLKNLRFHGIEMEAEGWQRQVCILWTEKASNGATVQCKALLDWLKLGDLIVIRDLKSVKSARPGEGLHKTMVNSGHHLQGTVYTRAVEAVFPEMAGRVIFQNVLVETEWPYEPLLTEFDGACRELARIQWQDAIDRWERCTRTGKWPGYMTSNEPYTVQLPSYMQADMFDDDEEDEDENPPLHEGDAS